MKNLSLSLCPKRSAIAARKIWRRRTVAESTSVQIAISVSRKKHLWKDTL